MTQIPKLSALFETSLASALSAAGASFTVVSGTDRDGSALSGLYGFIIDEGTASEEFVIGTISGTTVTISKRGLDADAPETEVAGNKKAHRRGASVKITDYPLLAYLRNALAGESGYELPAFLKLASTVGYPTDDKHVATKEYVDDVLSAGTGIPSKIVVAGTAGETISAGQLVYFDDTDNEWKLCDADTAATVENTFLGIAQGAGTDGNAIANGVLLFGVDANQSGLTIGAKYYASNTAGALSSSAGTKEVSIGWGKAATELYFCPRFDQHLTEDQQDAVSGGGNFGTPSSSNKFITESYNASASGLPVRRVYTANTPIGSSTTQVDITQPVGNTFRYTYDATGTDPSISAVTFPVGTVVDIQAQNFAAGNKGLFVVTGSGANYFEITNASGVVESNKTIGTGYIVKGGTWTKPAGLKYVTLEILGAGGSGEGASVSASSGNAGSGGGAGGYCRTLIASANLGSTENYVVGYKGIGVVGGGQGTDGGRSLFGSHCAANGGKKGDSETTTDDYLGGAGGSASGGDVTTSGAPGVPGSWSSGAGYITGIGGSSQYGAGGRPANETNGNNDGTDGESASGYGAGGGGARSAANGAAHKGGDGASGVIILTEYYS